MWKVLGGILTILFYCQWTHLEHKEVIDTNILVVYALTPDFIKKRGCILSYVEAESIGRNVGN